MALSYAELRFETAHRFKRRLKAEKRRECKGAGQMDGGVCDPSSVQWCWARILDIVYFEKFGRMIAIMVDGCRQGSECRKTLFIDATYFGRLALWVSLP